MINASDLPVWAALLVAFFLIAGCGLARLGAVGVVRR
jgi:multicomponent K+:H+ antiporter subunit G